MSERCMPACPLPLVMTSFVLVVLQATLRNKLPVLMLMGNKCDQCTDRKISREEGQKMALVSAILG